jgi:hypothetical protein
MMQTHIPDAEAILAKIERPYERSPLFEWLFAHHDEVITAAAGRRLEWSELCDLFAKEGLTDAHGKQVNARTARMTWWRVRKEHARIKANRRRHALRWPRSPAANNSLG